MVSEVAEAAQRPQKFKARGPRENKLRRSGVTGDDRMKALRFAQYGPPSVLTLQQCETPQPGPGESLVEVHAAAINPSDIKNVGGAFKTPLPRTPGRDYAGVVVAGE